MKELVIFALAKELAKNLKTEFDLNNFSKVLKKLMMGTALNGKLTEHLDYEKIRKLTITHRIATKETPLNP